MERSSFFSASCISRSARHFFFSSPASASFYFFPSATASFKPNPPIICGDD